ncbi:MAG: hypothetical protein SYNGOMJ08_00843 [Candidatus Syntrophoarchaeum sp. GoM_oil]|nr:MAG: hypothetical protein SYNGOMJ08_00843 [Candidatus Syntrophoarchaeum sp. GoM_oil]
MGWEEKKRWYLKHSLAIAIIVSIVSIFFVFELTSTRETIEAITEISPYYFLIAVIFHIFGWFVWGARIKVISGALSSRLSMRDAVKIVVTSLFTAAITPSHAGGEPVRVYLISRKGGIGFGDASAIVLLERVLDVIFIILISPVAILLLKDVIFQSGEEIKFLIGLSIVILIFSLFIIIQILYRPEWIKNRLPSIARVIGFFTGPARSERIMTRISAEMDAFIRSLRKFIEVARGRVLIAWILTTIYWSLEFLIPCLILIGLGEDPEILRAFASQIVLMVLVLVPLTPGSSGVAELGFMTVFAVFVKTSLLGILVLAWRFITYYLNIIVGGLFSLHIVNKG